MGWAVQTDSQSKRYVSSADLVGPGEHFVANLPRPRYEGQPVVVWENGTPRAATPAELDADETEYNRLQTIKGIRQAAEAATEAQQPAYRRLNFVARAIVLIDARLVALEAAAGITLTPQQAAERSNLRGILLQIRAIRDQADIDEGNA